MTWVADQPYNALPLLPPEGVELDSKRILKSCFKARMELQALNIRSSGVNTDLILRQIPLLEAQGSNEIEGVMTTADEMFAADYRADARLKGPIKETLGYAEALTRYVGLPLDTGLAEEICSSIKGERMNVRVASRDGKRTRIGNRGFEEKIIYTPPEGEGLIREKLRNWGEFVWCSVNQERNPPQPNNYDPELDPIVRLALAHYQFEAIHPFSDGNGRTGRILNVLFLINAGLLDKPILYHSRAILKRKEEYYHLLRQVTEKREWEPWILFVASVIEETAKWTLSQIEKINELKDHTTNYVLDRLGDNADQRMVDLIFDKPVTVISDVVERGIAKRETASKKLKKLAKLDILVERKKGRTLEYEHTKLFKVLNQVDNHHFEPYAEVYPPWVKEKMLNFSSKIGKAPERLDR